MFSVINVYLDHLKFCVVCNNGRRYVMLSLMSVMSPPHALCNLSLRTVVKLCFDFRGELGFLNCDDMLLLYAFRDLWKEWGDSILRSFHRTASSTTGGWSRWDILIFFYISFRPLRSHFWTLRMPYYFYNVSFFMYISNFFRKYNLRVCYVFNVIWPIILMTDGLNVV